MESISQTSANILLTILAAVVYTFLTIGTTKDVQLITNSAVLKLPVINTDIPVVGVFLVTPFLLLVLFFYFQIYLLRLWETLAQLPAIPNGRRLDQKTYPWLVNDLVREHFRRLRRTAPPLSKIQAFLSIAVGYWLVPITLAAIWLYFLRIQDWHIISFRLILLGLAVTGAS